MWYLTTMPNENDKTPPVQPAAVAPDTSDAQIADLKKQVADLEKKLLSSSSKAKVPSGDYCFLGGVAYPVAGTVTCRFATDEGRKGHIDLDEELIVVKR